MPMFRYAAVDGGGKVTRGTMEASSQAALVDRIQAGGRLPLRVDAAEGRRGALRDLLSADLFADRGLGKTELADVTRELAVMLGAGQTLDQALRFLVETAPAGRTRALLEAVREQVRNGAPLAAALRKHPSSFSRLYVGLVQAGETTGKLADTLAHLATLLERQRSLAAAIRSAMVYPALLVAAAIASVALLLVYVLPQFVPIFEEAGADLPAATRMLLAIGEAVRNHGLLALAGLAAGVLLLRWALRQPAPREAADRWLLRLPVVGTMVRQAQAALLTRTLGSLLANGVGLLPALAIAREVLGNRAAARAVEQAAASAKEGAGLSAPLARTGVFPARAIHLLRVGEETSRLAEMSLRAADIHEEQFRQAVQRLVSLMVPAITIALGLVVAGIIGSLLVAMLSLNELVL